MTRPRILCVLSAPRSGSNLLCNALENIAGVRNLVELFHPRWVGRRLDETEVATLAAHAGGREALTRWRSAHPGRVLDMLLDRGPSGPLVIKVFPRHVACRRLRREVLQRTDTAFVVLSRRPIDSFISMTNASLSGRFSKVDTTSRRPAIDARLFARWAHERRRWFRWLDLCLERHSITPARLSYERDLAPDPVAAAGAIAARFGFPLSPAPGPLVLRRQDRETDFRRRVANREAFAADADPELLAWATGTPSPGGCGADGSGMG